MVDNLCVFRGGSLKKMRLCEVLQFALPIYGKHLLRSGKLCDRRQEGLSGGQETRVTTLPAVFPSPRLDMTCDYTNNQFHSFDALS